MKTIRNKSKISSSAKINDLITKDMAISEIITQYPSTASLLLSWGLHCVGCFAATFDTLESGAAVHGIEGEDLKKMMAQLNKIAQQELAGDFDN